MLILECFAPKSDNERVAVAVLISANIGADEPSRISGRPHQRFACPATALDGAWIIRTTISVKKIRFNFHFRFSHYDR